jgi:cytochrome c
LYAVHCSGCHGASGDGNGRGARHLFPKPRDFGTGQFRLVSTVNGFPTLEDLASVIRRGMPGTSMRAFDNLSEDQRMLLAREVLRLSREGFRERLADALRSEADEIDQDEIDEAVELCTTPGDVVSIPRIGPADSQAVARGKETYFELGCNKCHGDDGTGVWDTPLYDEQGRFTPARDLAREPFKGGQEPESIYLRIFAGMPGSPHPACWNVPSDQLVDLVQFCRSLSREPKRVPTNHQRAVQTASKPPVWILSGSSQP